jgi:apolipoprotein N-acyltransferase
MIADGAAAPGRYRERWCLGLYYKVTEGVGGAGRIWILRNRSSRQADFRERIGVQSSTSYNVTRAGEDEVTHVNLPSLVRQRIGIIKAGSLMRIARKTDSPNAGPELRVSRLSPRLLVLLGLITSVLLAFCFPIAGPLPVWRVPIAWVAIVPLFGALLNEGAVAHPRYLWRATLGAYLCGFLWYLISVSWIYQTTHNYAHRSPVESGLILVAFCTVVSLYFGIFGLLLALSRRRLGLLAAIILAPFLWVAIDLVAARVTSFPWNQLGYSQIDNPRVSAIASYTGVYGITWLLVLGNAVLTMALLRRNLYILLGAIVAILTLISGIWTNLPATPTSQYAVLLQPNIDIASNVDWIGHEWDGNTYWLLQESRLTCTSAFTGMPYAGLPDTGIPIPDVFDNEMSEAGPSLPLRSCAENTPPPGVVVWPEAPGPFVSNDATTQAVLRREALAAHAPVIAGLLGRDPSGTYSSALFVSPDGAITGRYDKIHLVPFGEFIPYPRLFFFTHPVSHEPSDLMRGTEIKVFKANGHTFSAFIGYESIFSDEVRRFARNGAEVFVNITDNGWFGNSAGSWQQLNMTRMRAIENLRWILVDANTGVTTAIDPFGRVTFSAPRYQPTSLDVRYGYRSEISFYTRYGDLFAYVCCAVTLFILLISVAARKQFVCLTQFSE